PAGATAPRKRPRLIGRSGARLHRFSASGRDLETILRPAYRLARAPDRSRLTYRVGNSWRQANDTADCNGRGRSARATETMNVSLPDSLKRYVEQWVAERARRASTPAGRQLDGDGRSRRQRILRLPSVAGTRAAPAAPARVPSSPATGAAPDPGSDSLSPRRRAARRKPSPRPAPLPPSGAGAKPSAHPR